MEYKLINFERREHIGILTLNRPEKLNALSFEFAKELIDFFSGLKDDLQTRVVIIRSEGRIFSAGIDLNDVAKVLTQSDNDNRLLGMMQNAHVFGRTWMQIVLSMRQAPQPIIAAVKGHAIGAGFSICMACDVRIAGESAQFNAAFIRIGLSGGDMGSSYFLPRLIGLSRAAELLYTGRFMDAITAVRIGFVSRVVSDDQLDASALELANEMLDNSPFGLRMTKELLNVNIDAPSIESAVQLENRTQTICGFSEDAKEAQKAFFEKRAPKYTDR